MGFITIEFLKTQFNNFATRISSVFATKEYVNDVASGKEEKAKVFNTKDDLDTWLAVDGNPETLKVGQNIYIKAEDTPDYWWDGTGLQPLETEKVNLDGYLTEDDAETENIDFSDYFSTAGGGE